jgi:hypothetical protein
VRYVLLTLVATAALSAGASGAAASVQSGARATATPLEAANNLMSLPWERIGKQLDTDIEHALEEYEDQKLVDANGSVGITYKGVGVTAKWGFNVRLREVKAQVDLSRPPGVRSASTREVAFAAPKDGGWSFGYQAVLHPHAYVKVAGVKIWRLDPIVPFAIGIKDFRIDARAELNDSEPDRPRLVKATVTPQLKLGGAGMFPGVIPITFSTTVEAGKLTLRSSSIDIPLADFGLADAHFNAVLTVVLEPPPPALENDATYKMRMTVRLKGKLTAEIRYVPKAKESFDFEILSFKGNAGSFPELNEFLQLTKQATPRSWGENQKKGWVPPPPAALDYAKPAAAIEAGIDAHLPYGGVLSIDCEAPRAGPLRTCNKPSWAGDEDSAIWTGHYLAAEAFRYGSGDAAALPRVQKALAGIERLFWVTGDAAYGEGKRVVSTSPTGILARTAAPSTQTTPYNGKALDKRDCYYERPEGGWSVGRAKYARLAEVPSASRDEAEPVGKIWRGWGCGRDMPVSKDQYIGVFYGLAVAHQLVPAVQPRVQVLIRQALDYLLANKWNVRLPPKNRYETSFLGDFSKQMVFLRIGATVLGGSYADTYARFAPANDYAWLPIWFTTVDPVLQYYKFNLSNATLASALLLETEPARRAGFTYAHSVLWRAVRHHRNAYFALLRVLDQPPAQRAGMTTTKTPWLDPTMTVGQEIRSVLADWIQRYEAVKFHTGMPTGAVGDPSVQAGLGPGEVADFVGFDATVRKLAVYALPIAGRNGLDKDFVWQRDPFDISYKGSRANCTSLPPQADEVQRCGGRPNRVHPGVDYLLAYWLARYLRIV